MINNHLLTIILLKDDVSIGYAHIDFDENKYWFGICIIPEYHGRGYGKLMMEYLFNNVHCHMSKARNLFFLECVKELVIALEAFFQVSIP